MTSLKTKIIFWGTPEFAEIILEKMIQDKSLEILAVVTAPDKPVGRKHILTPSLVKVLAEKNSITVLQPEKLGGGFIDELKKINSDLNVVAGYGKIIPLEILEIPKHKSINIHPSLLPKYRGPSPIQTALLNGDTETGATIMLIDEKMDHGKAISKIQVLISKDDNYKSLSKKLADLSAELLIKTIPEYVLGKIQPVKQEHNKATFCKIIKKQDGEIDWENNAEQIYNQWRAFYEWPGIYSQLTVNSKQLLVKFINIKLVDKKSPAQNSVGLQNNEAGRNNSIGKFFVKDKKLYITCKNNSVLEIISLQPEGKKVMDARSFINGYLSSKFSPPVIPAKAGN